MITIGIVGLLAAAFALQPDACIKILKLPFYPITAYMNYRKEMKQLEVERVQALSNMKV